jgi:branched-chain amino acid transport system substrate-binding protein
MRYCAAVILFCFSALTARCEPVKVGAIVSLSGPAAEQGRNWLQGAELAQARLLHQGIHVDLKVEDDGTRPAGAVSAFTKLVNQNEVRGIVGGTWDFVAEALAPLVQRSGIPFITPSNPVEVFSRETTQVPNFFTNGLSVRATEEAIRKVLPVSGNFSISLVVPNVPFGTLHADIFRRSATSGRGRIVSETIFEYAGYHDTLKAAATKLATQKPQVVFCLADYSGLNVFVTELNRRNYSGLILTTQHLDEAARLARNTDRFRNVIGFYPLIQDEGFREAFKAKFGHSPKVYAAEGHDALWAIAHALTGSIDHRRERFEVTGVTGKLTLEPGRTEIVHLEAVPMVLDTAGELTPWSRDTQSGSS